MSSLLGEFAQRETLSSAPASASQAHANLSLQQQSVPATSCLDPEHWWRQLLLEEQAIERRESFMTVSNLRWSTAAWDELHNRSDKLARDMAVCAQLLKEVE